MTEYGSSVGTTDNIVDKAAHSAAKAVDATKGATIAALDSVAGRVENVRSTLSPALNSATAPFDKVLDYTTRNPATALMAAAAAGALFAAILLPARSRRR
jgi:hypothetical protein